MSTEGHVQKHNLNDVGNRRKQNFHTEPVSHSSKRNPADFFIVKTEKTRETRKQFTPEQKRERFSSERPRSLTKFFFRTQKQEKEKTREETKSKFASIVSKHFLPFRFVTSLKSSSKETLTPSDISICENTSIETEACNTSESEQTIVEDISGLNIITPEILLAKPTRLGSENVDSGEIGASTSNLFYAKQKRVKHLPIPLSSPATNEQFPAIDIFTTSYTRSNTLKKMSNLSESQCKSAQELTKSPPKSMKQRIIRSYSDTPSRSFLDTDLPIHIPLSMQANMYRNENISQILDYLFIGSIEAAYNEPQLCRLKIESLVDMSNTTTTQVPSFKKSHCPCLCSQRIHFRSRLIIRVDDKETEDLEQYFSEINKFIDGAKRCGKKVLIFSYYGKSRAPAAAIQYLMKNENFLLRQAYNLVKNHRSVVDINQGFQEALEAQERRLFPQAKPSISFSNEYLNIADPQAIKCAWVDCTDM